MLIHGRIWICLSKGSYFSTRKEVRESRIIKGEPISGVRVAHYGVHIEGEVLREPDVKNARNSLSKKSMRRNETQEYGGERTYAFHGM